MLNFQEPTNIIAWRDQVSNAVCEDNTGHPDTADVIKAKSIGKIVLRDQLKSVMAPKTAAIITK